MSHSATLGLLALAGAIGTLCRFGLSGLVMHITGRGFPWGTLVVNASGCLLFGLIAVPIESRLPLTPQSRLILLTGFLGAFTTFSTFAYESAEQLHESSWLPAMGNILGQNALGIACIFAGMALARAL